MAFTEFLRTIDYFGVKVNFNYKSEKKYRSVVGGSIFATYIIACFAYISITFVSFYNKKHKTVIYYDKELPETDEISFIKHSSAFAINLYCDTYDENQAKKYGNLNELFKINANHVKFIKELDGYMNKTKTKLSLHKCNHSDFFNKFDEQLDRNDITDNFYCFTDNNYLVKGIYAAKDFQYYEFTLAATQKISGENYSSLIYENDCKFNLYFIDNAVDVANITHPMSEFLNEKFIQLSPVDYSKVNLYYTIKSFQSDENWFLTWPSQDYYIAYSHFEEYKMAKGENRFETKIDDFEKYGKFFIRASPSRNIIERRYEKLTEYVASSTSILSAVLLFLVAVVGAINDRFAMKDIIDTLCIEQKKGLEKKILLKAKFANCNDLESKKNGKINFIHRQSSAKMAKNMESIYQTENDLVLDKRRSTTAQIGSLVNNLNDNSNCYDNSQNKIINNNINNLKFLNAKNLNTKINNYLIESFNEKKKEIGYSGEKKNNNISDILNSMINKNDGKVNVESSGQKFQINEEHKKNGLVTESFRNHLTLENKFNSSVKIKDKLTELNKRIKSSILAYHFCKFFTICKGKPEKNSHEFIMGNLLFYFIKRLDILNYLKMIKHQELMLNLLYEDNSYFLVRKLEELYYSSKSTIDENEIFSINEQNRRSMGKVKIKETDVLWDSIVKLMNKVNKTKIEYRLLDLMIKEINDI